MAEIDRLVKNLGLQKKDLLQYYSEVFKSKNLDIFFSNTKQELAERHKWTSHILIADFELRKKSSPCTIIPFGKSQIKQFKSAFPYATLWVAHVVTTPKQKKVVHKSATVFVDFYLLKEGLLDANGIQFFHKYNDVRLEKVYDRKLNADDRAIPLPPAEPLFTTPKQFFQELGVKAVRMKDLGNYSKLSSTTRYGTPRYYDIRCIPNCTILEKKSWVKSFRGWDYTTGYIDISDDSHDGLMTDDGRLIPFKFRCWVHPDFMYPKDTFGDTFGVLRVNPKGDTVFDLCYFDVIHMGEESEKQTKKSESKTKRKKQKKKSKSKVTAKRKSSRKRKLSQIERKDLLQKVFLE